MEQVQEKKNPLGAEPINRLLIRFAIPSIIAMLVSALYNMIDQFFIGRSVGMLGNAATNVAFPLSITCTALALLCGIGGAANFNLALGGKDEKKAERHAGSAIGMMLGFGILLCVMVQIFLKPMMIAFGATDRVLDYAMTYTSITSWGFPFLIFTIGGSSLIRADGSPAYSMSCNLVGAAVNLVLDPLFIFGFHMGMTGAALATVIGQVISSLMVFRYLCRFRTLHIRLKSLIPTGEYSLPIFALGIAPFFNQTSMMMVQIVMNQTLTYYGARSVYGSDIPLACAGIIAKVGMLFFSMVIGISQGLQPICSFNYGAEQYNRVKETYKKALKAALSISVVSFICFQLFPRQIIGLFGGGSKEYYLFAEQYFRIYLFFTFLNGIQPVTANFFTAIGKAQKGLFMSLTRQIIFLLPLLILLPMLLGIEGIMYSGPIADVIAAGLAIFFAIREFRLMDKNDVKKTKNEIFNP